ncbi:hypothetical protein C8F01DRAFT_1163424 [Mycena amicta]|nr:hypothetical protein C8F01DRAFT_1163424 [Mycena amicta]
MSLCIESSLARFHLDFSISPRLLSRSSSSAAIRIPRYPLHYPIILNACGVDPTRGGSRGAPSASSALRVGHIGFDIFEAFSECDDEENSKYKRQYLRPCLPCSTALSSSISTTCCEGFIKESRARQTATALVLRFAEFVRCSSTKIPSSILSSKCRPRRMRRLSLADSDETSTKIPTASIPQLKMSVVALPNDMPIALACGSIYLYFIITFPLL